MVFVADSLGDWLTRLLADSGRRKLNALVLGSDQERALRSAATAAVQLTAKELCPSNDEQAGQLAIVISEVFRGPTLGEPRYATVLEALQAGIAEQMSLLDDASLTGTGRSSADVLGVPGAVLAQTLTGHLLREIVIRGARGGPLSPLASQLNHDVSYLQNRDIEAANRRIEAAIAELQDSRKMSAKWSAVAAALSVVVAAASGLLTTLATSHSSWGLWVALVVLVIVGAFLQAAVVIGDRLRMKTAIEKIKNMRTQRAVG